MSDPLATPTNDRAVARSLVLAAETVQLTRLRVTPVRVTPGRVTPLWIGDHGMVATPAGRRSGSPAPLGAREAANSPPRDRRASAPALRAGVWAEPGSTMPARATPRPVAGRAPDAASRRAVPETSNGPPRSPRPGRRSVPARCISPEKLALPARRRPGRWPGGRLVADRPSSGPRRSGSGSAPAPSVPGRDGRPRWDSRARTGSGRRGGQRPVPRPSHARRNAPRRVAIGHGGPRPEFVSASLPSLVAARVTSLVDIRCEYQSYLHVAWEPTSIGRAISAPRVRYPDAFPSVE